MLLLSRDGHAVLFCDNFTRRSAVGEVFVSEEIIQPWYDHQHSVTNRHLSLSSALSTYPRTIDPSALLVERDGLSVELTSVIPNSLTSISVGSTSSSLGTVIRRLRRTKQPDELSLIQNCMNAGAAGQAAAFNAVVPGATELDVYISVQAAAQQTAGCPCIVYGDFRATNADVFRAGGLPTEHRLKTGDMMILDFSVVIAGYRSDFTNTVAVGIPTSEQASQAEACIAALTAGESKLVAGTGCASVFETVDAQLVQRGFPGLSHHAGHGLGLEHPEAPILVPHSTDNLLPGDVVTLEPGLYIKGVGGMRFEHNYVITDSGCERLSRHDLGLQPG
ncbi:MAG: M24 family metallopeptidase [Fuerstiella sp.]|nr:M24 family metallopeptidase [Fuerstiella sp.]